MITRIRRISYPLRVCVSAWAYKNKTIMTQYTRSAYRIYKLNGYSFKRLFMYIQKLFDTMYA